MDTATSISLTWGENLIWSKRGDKTHKPTLPCLEPSLTWNALNKWNPPPQSICHQATTSGSVLTHKCLLKMVERREQCCIPAHPAYSQVRGTPIPQGKRNTVQYPQFKSVHGKSHINICSLRVKSMLKTSMFSVLSPLPDIQLELKNYFLSEWQWLTHWQMDGWLLWIKPHIRAFYFPSASS